MEIGSLASLEYLDLEMNQFEGPLPVEVGSLGELRVRQLLVRPYRAVLERSLTTLLLGAIRQELVIAKNFFTGAMPTEVGNLMQLRNLAANDNLFEGECTHYCGLCDGSGHI